MQTNSPQCYIIKKAILLDNCKLQLPSTLNLVHIVEFAEGDLTDPKADPIVVSFQNGCRQYYWSGRLFHEIQLDIKSVIDSINMLTIRHAINVIESEQLIRMMYLYRIALPPKNVAVPAKSPYSYCRAIYATAK